MTVSIPFYSIKRVRFIFRSTVLSSFLCDPLSCCLSPFSYLPSYLSSSVPACLSDFLSSLINLSSASILLSVQFCRYPFTFVFLSVSVLSLTSLSVLLAVSQWFLCPLFSLSIYLSVPALSRLLYLFITDLSLSSLSFLLSSQLFFTYLSQICLCPLYLSCCLPSSSPVVFTHMYCI